MGVSSQLHNLAALPLRERAISNLWIGGCVGPRAGLDAVEKIIFSCPCWDSNPNSLIVHHAAKSLHRLSYTDIVAQQ
jgi:hypothetical protein